MRSCARPPFALDRISEGAEAEVEPRAPVIRSSPYEMARSDNPPAKKPAAKKPAAKKPAAKKPAAGKLRRRDRSRPASEQHRRVVAAVQQMFRLCPLDAARWIWKRHGSTPYEVVEALWIEQAPRGPAYVVPPPRVEEDRPPTPEAVLARVLKSAIEGEAAASKGKIKVKAIDFDFDEAMRQTLAEGGCEVELYVKLRRGTAKPVDMIFGVMLPDEREDGTETPWAMLGKTSWHLLAGDRILGTKGKRMPLFLTVPLYLWPGTGLVDPQESCSVFTGELSAPGILGDLLKLQGEEERARERARSRKLNLERLERQQALDRARRDAAARRLALTGDAGVTERELAALVPAIDVDNDRITMIHSYDIVRLWEEPLDDLLASLPPACLGLALFGWRPPGMSAVNALERGAFALRRALRGKPALEAQRAALSLASLGAAFLDPDEVTRLLRSMKLL